MIIFITIITELQILFIDSYNFIALIIIYKSTANYPEEKELSTQKVGNFRNPSEGLEIKTTVMK